MASKNTKKTAKRARLGWIGVWATIWWGVSCFYLVLLVWAGKDRYATLSSSPDSGSSLSNWQSALSGAYRDSDFLPALLALIVVVWVIGGWLWLREVRRQNVGYGAAFKDLFLTIRK